jgi:hypothetical protein
MCRPLPKAYTTTVLGKSAAVARCIARHKYGIARFVGISYKLRPPPAKEVMYTTEVRKRDKLMIFSGGFGCFRLYGTVAPESELAWNLHRWPLCPQVSILLKSGGHSGGIEWLSVH